MSLILFFILSIAFNTNNSFKGELDNYLKKNLTEYQDYKYEIIQLPSSYKEIELLKPNDFNLSGNMIYVPVQIIDKNGRKFRSILSVKLKLYKNVLVAVKKINRKTDLKENDFTYKKEDITRIKGFPVYSIKGINLLRSKVLIKPGDVLIKQMTEKIPVIKIGDVLNAKYISGSVVISLKVFSRQEGTTGGIITVITSDKKLFKAKIIDSKNVIIIE
jgi:flagella basal body P-ring formation protein FlgA